MRDFEIGGGTEPSRAVAGGTSMGRSRAGKFFVFLVLGLAPIAFGKENPKAQAAEAALPAVTQAEPAAKDTVAKQPAAAGKPDAVAQTAAVQASPQDPAAMETARLLKLATELKAAVNKSNKDILSIRVVKTAEEIEKLSRTEQRELRASLANK